MTNEPNTSEWRQAIEYAGNIEHDRDDFAYGYLAAIKRVCERALELASTRTAPSKRIMINPNNTKYWHEQHEWCPECVGVCDEVTTAPPTTQGELLPCPFCGTTNPMIYEEYQGTPNSEWTVCCNGDCDGRISGNSSGSKESAIKAWNNRTAARKDEGMKDII